MTSSQPQMSVIKRNGSKEPVNINKIMKSVGRVCSGLSVDPLRVATKTVNGLFDGVTTVELDKLSIQTSAELIGEEPDYSKLSGRLLANFIDKEVKTHDIASFSQSIALGFELGLISETTAMFVEDNSRKLDRSINPSANKQFEYFGLKTVYDRYLLKHPTARTVLETPQYFMMRVACGLSQDVREAVQFYDLMSSFAYMPSSPTLFNSGTAHSQMSSCYLIDSPKDSLESIYDRYKQVAQLSKYAGGIGVAFSRVRGRGTLIRGTNGPSNGIVPWLKTLDSSVAAVNQGGRRKGAACVYLETWHPDIEEFLELKDNAGEDARRTYNLNLANWVPDEFMRRVEADEDWSLIDPDTVPELPDLWGSKFDQVYRQAEREGKAVRTLPARELYGRMMKTLAETGNGWMTFKDRANTLCNQTNDRNGSPTVHLSNLCVEIIEVTSNDETAVCNLGSINLAQHVDEENKRVDWDKLRSTVRTAVPFLDRVIDINFYPSQEAKKSNPKWRPVGLGLMGWQDVCFKLGLDFDCVESRLLAKLISEEVYLTALEVSNELARDNGPHPSYVETRAAEGNLQPDLWDVEVSQKERWGKLKENIAQYGLRNSLLIAIAPTATIAGIVGAYECIEPQVSNLFKRETLSGEFAQVNNYLVNDLKKLNLWTPEIRDSIKKNEGSIQSIDVIPADLKSLYRTAWELPQKALIDLAVARGPFVDQSQSLNLFMAGPTIGKLSSMYLYAWKSGLKTTYYLRSRPATRIMQTTTTQEKRTITPPQLVTVDSSAIACSLENPETCEACQ